MICFACKGTQLSMSSMSCDSWFKDTCTIPKSIGSGWKCRKPNIKLNLWGQRWQCQSRDSRPFASWSFPPHVRSMFSKLMSTRFEPRSSRSFIMSVSDLDKTFLHSARVPTPTALSCLHMNTLWIGMMMDDVNLYNNKRNPAAKDDSFSRRFPAPEALWLYLTKQSPQSWLNQHLLCQGLVTQLGSEKTGLEVAHASVATNGSCSTPELFFNSLGFPFQKQE